MKTVIRSRRHCMYCEGCLGFNLCRDRTTCVMSSISVFQEFELSPCFLMALVTSLCLLRDREERERIGGRRAKCCMKFGETKRFRSLQIANFAIAKSGNCQFDLRWPTKRYLTSVLVWIVVNLSLCSSINGSLILWGMEGKWVLLKKISHKN